MEWFKIPEAAQRLGLSVDMTYKLCGLKKIAHRRIGEKRGKIQISQASIDAYLRSCEVAVVEEPIRRSAKPKIGRLPGNVRPDGKPMQFIK